MRLVVVNLSARTISGGYEEYLKQFFTHAGKEPDIQGVLFIAVKAVTDKFAGMPKVQTLELGPLGALLGSVRKVRQKIESFRPDVVYVPMEKRCKGLPKLPVVTMVQNMEPFVPPIAGNSLLWNLVLRKMRKRAISAIRHSTHVITLSEFAHQTVVRESGISPTKVSKIPHGMERNSLGKGSRPSSLDDSCSFIFTAGSLSPARGLEDVIKAFILLRNSGQLAGFKLCIAGAVHKYSQRWYRRLAGEISRAGLDDEVKWLGFLGKDEMQWCFRNTRLFVVTSRVESFCITAVEAMANDAPVISADSPCLPETLGKYATYYDAGDWHQLAQKIRENLGESSGKERIVPDSMISWDENFAKTSAVFHNLTNKR